MKIKLLPQCLRILQFTLYGVGLLFVIPGNVFSADIIMTSETGRADVSNVYAITNDRVEARLWNANRPSQAVVVSGKVVSGDDQQSLPGVNVAIKGTTQGTVTDVNGEFSVEVPSRESVLVFSFVGFLNEEVTVGNQSNLNVTPRPDITSLSEVVVIRYGTQEKMKVTGAVATVQATDIVKVPSPNVSEIMIGKVPGLSSMQSQGVPGALMQSAVDVACKEAATRSPGWSAVFDPYSNEVIMKEHAKIIKP